MGRIRVLVVEDSLMFRSLLVKHLNADPELEVVAEASNPFEARDKIIQYKPDVMTLDVELPKMDGIEFLKKLMPQYPLRTIVVSSLSDKVFDALHAGAVDFVAKPMEKDRYRVEEFVKRELPYKVKIAAKARLRRFSNEPPVTMGLESNHAKIPLEVANDSQTIIAIGASTGGTEATANILKGFDSKLPGIVITQHMPAGFTRMYAERLDQRSNMNIRVKEAQNGDVIRPGLALLAPGGDSHMEVKKINGQFQVVLRNAPKVNGHCPSVDVLFDSVAKAAGANAIGIILTGMGGDGAKGLLAMRKAGARTIGQDESTCVVYGMPKVAYQMGAVEFQEKLEDIPRKTYQILSQIK